MEISFTSRLSDPESIFADYINLPRGNISSYGGTMNAAMFDRN